MDRATNASASLHGAWVRDPCIEWCPIGAPCGRTRRSGGFSRASEKKISKRARSGRRGGAHESNPTLKLGVWGSLEGIYKLRTSVCAGLKVDLGDLVLTFAYRGVRCKKWRCPFSTLVLSIVIRCFLLLTNCPYRFNDECGLIAKTD